MATTEQLPPAPGLPGDEQNEREFARKLAERYRFAFIDLREQRIDAELFRTIPADLMFRYNFVPLEVHNNVLAIAAADPGQVQMSDELPLLLGKKLLIRVATARQIGDILKRTEQSQRVLEQATEAFTLQTSKEEDEADETISGDRLTRDSTASPVVRLVETIIFTALERRASDIHIEARDTEVAVKYRIDGVLQHAMQPIAKEHHSSVLSRIKVLSELDIAERRVPQDGRFRVKYKGRFIDLRVSIMPASHGEDAVLRVLDKETLSEKFSSLTLDVVGFSDEETRRFRRYIREPYGMVLVTALTGHLVFTTVHANNVTDVIGRFINMGVEPYNFVSALNCIMAQRLVRVICTSCKKPKRYSPEELKEAGLDPAVWGNVTFAEGAGCLECSGTGYHGRTAICELLDLTDRIREMIVDRRPTSEIKRVACEAGMITLRESGLAKIRAGITTVQPINKDTSDD